MEGSEGKETGGEIHDHDKCRHTAAPYRSLNFSSDLLSLIFLRGSPFFDD